jgi:hypothetical protein
MAAWLTDDGELDRLNLFCAGKVLASIEYVGGSDDLTLHFSDGSSARLSTLGGLEVEELKA